MGNGALNVTLRPADKLQIDLRNLNTSKLSVSTPTSITLQDYNYLKNLPTLGGVVIKGNMSYADLFLTKQSVNTTEYWNSNPSYVPEIGEIVIYNDRSVIDDVSYPGIKIGDGTTYLVDLPFLSDELFNGIIDSLNEHINNSSIHVTSENKNFWNNKLNYELENENLILNRE